MAKRWLPERHRLADGTVVGRLLHSGAEWQILALRGNARLLAAHPSLVERWTRGGLVSDTLFEATEVGDVKMALLRSGTDRRIEPAADAALPQRMEDCIAFALSLRETRKVESDAPLHDALYVERYSRLLPTWTVSERVPDEKVLGRWLTGGVSVLATSSRRVAALMGWLDPGDVRELVAKAGLGEIEREASEARSAGTETQRAPKIAKKGAFRRSGGEQAASSSRSFHLAGRQALTAFLREHIVDIVENPERYEALGIGFPSSVVLHGPPGCGKTFAVRQLTEYLDWPMYSIESSSVGSPYIHQTAMKVGKLFAKAISEAPSVVVIEEMEAFLAERHAEARHQAEEVGEFLQRIPEAQENKVLVVGTTNRLEMLDTAVLRRGRFDHVVEVGVPSTEEVSELLGELLRKTPTDGELDVHQLAGELSGRTLSDVVFVVREGARLSARAGMRFLNQDRLRTALSSLPPLGRPSSIGFGEG